MIFYWLGHHTCMTLDFLLLTILSIQLGSFERYGTLPKSTSLGASAYKQAASKGHARKSSLPAGTLETLREGEAPICCSAIEVSWAAYVKCRVCFVSPRKHADWFSCAWNHPGHRGVELGERFIRSTWSWRLARQVCGIFTSLLLSLSLSNDFLGSVIISWWDWSILTWNY